ncbi:hypothetical protein JCM3766R1_004094 [Sporobolomyces carnicolor]
MWNLARRELDEGRSGGRKGDERRHRSGFEIRGRASRAPSSSEQSNGGEPALHENLGSTPIPERISDDREIPPSPPRSSHPRRLDRPYRSGKLFPHFAPPNHPVAPKSDLDSVPRDEREGVSRFHRMKGDRFPEGDDRDEAFGWKEGLAKYDEAGSGGESETERARAERVGSRRE